MDVHDRKTRSKNMRAIRSKSTKLETSVKKVLETLSLKMVEHPKNIPGNPDYFVSSLNIAIFCHGCFWHAHECSLFKLPETQREFWAKKLRENTVRDLKAIRLLSFSEIRVLIIWECAIKGKEKLPAPLLPVLLSTWINGKYQIGIINSKGLANYNAPDEVICQTTKLLNTLR
ncbi:DNA mismatch endonuclease Vsr [Pseudoalteromonas rubra]|uniref:very short patch repair endonuclease n=1 Tax=Pseudoalteromonas rubra TaxID=43658 RepID=UPI002DB922B4|nr:DNA mismatch endonuclease Vsr [Pseudoalteromonas rubra]MEC4088878.1 DNA mismatch endonuclease Vsr [Pseudoalteromonas rubra]